MATSDVGFDVDRCPACGTRNRVPAAARGVPRCGSCRSALPWITSADEATFDDIVVRARMPVLLDLWAPWCGPCRAVSPLLEELGRELAGRLKVVKINVDAAPALAARFNAQSIPTLVLTRSGRELSRRVGALPMKMLRSWLVDEIGPPASPAES